MLMAYSLVVNSCYEILTNSWYCFRYLELNTNEVKYFCANNCYLFLSKKEEQQTTKQANVQQYIHTVHTKPRISFTAPWDRHLSSVCAAVVMSSCKRNNKMFHLMFSWLKTRKTLNKYQEGRYPEKWVEWQIEILDSGVERTIYFNNSNLND